MFRTLIRDWWWRLCMLCTRSVMSTFSMPQYQHNIYMDSLHFTCTWGAIKKNPMLTIAIPKLVHVILMGFISKDYRTKCHTKLLANF